MIEQAPFKVGGYFEVECYDKKGDLKWSEVAKNLVPADGLDHILDVVLHGATQITTWYVVPFENDHSPATSDSYATPGFTECTAYDEANRVEYNEAAADGQSITNSANKASFTINATKTIYGAALVGGGTNPSVKGNATSGGVLLCEAQFTSSKSVEDDDTLEVTYTISAADDGA